MNFSRDCNITECLIANQVFSSTYKALIVAEIVAAIFTIVPHLLLLSAVWHVTVFPSNLRLLLGHASCQLLLFSCYTLLKNIYLLTTPVCSFTISVRWCKIIDMPGYGIALPNAFYSMVAVCVERLYATINYRKYDNNQKPYLAIFLIVGSWTTALLLNGEASLMSLPNDRYVPFCDLTFMSSPTSQYIFPSYVLTEFLTVSTTIAICCYNRHIAKNMAINRAKYDLSSRFLVDQNVQINGILLPSMICHLMCHLPAFTIMIPANLTGALALSLSTKSWLYRTTFLWRLIYSLVDPTIAFYFNTHLRQHLLKGVFGRFMRKAGVDLGKAKKITNVYSQTVAHFDYLEKSWGLNSKPKRAAGVGKSKIKKNKVGWSDEVISI